MLAENGFDRAAHEHIRADLIDGRLGLAQNRLPASAVIQDVQPGDVIDATVPLPRRMRPAGARPSPAGRRQSSRWRPAWAAAGRKGRE
jgi:hypothetical protein